MASRWGGDDGRREALASGQSTPPKPPGLAEPATCSTRAPPSEGTPSPVKSFAAVVVAGDAPALPLEKGGSPAEPGLASTARSPLATTPGRHPSVPPGDFSGNLAAPPGLSHSDLIRDYEIHQKAIWDAHMQAASYWYGGMGATGLPVDQLAWSYGYGSVPLMPLGDPAESLLAGDLRQDAKGGEESDDLDLVLPPGIKQERYCPGELFSKVSTLDGAGSTPSTMPPTSTCGSPPGVLPPSLMGSPMPSLMGAASPSHFFPYLESPLASTGPVATTPAGRLDSGGVAGSADATREGSLKVGSLDGVSKNAAKEDNAELGEACPNVGSAGHHLRLCKPCAFVNTKGCKDGVECRFCHLCESGEKKRRKKEKSAIWRSLNHWPPQADSTAWA